MSVNMPPAHDPSSVESFLRLRRSQLRDGRARGTREEAERRSAEHDAERVLDLLSRMPVEEYIPAASDGTLVEAQYAWLRRHGLERGRVDAALAVRRKALERRVHNTLPVDSAMTAAGGPPRRGSRSGPSAPARPPAVVASSHELILQHATNALAAGTNPRTVERWTRQQLARLTWSGTPSAPLVVDQGAREPSNPRFAGRTTGAPDRPAPRVPRRRPR